MVSVIVIWSYMAVTCYIIGFTCFRVIRGKQDYRMKKESGYFYAGLVAVTVYAQFFSIFYKVGLLANLILLCMCVVSALALRKELTQHLRELFLTITPFKAGAVVLLFVLFAYGASTGIIHYDTGLYHAQSIRWIEEYGIVPGLGNLHSRLAYNSASFCLSALYSFAFMGGRSFHCCAGFMAFLLSAVCFTGFSKESLKKPRLSDLIRLLGIYYLLMIFDEMVSPASDYFMVLTVFYILISWLSLLEEKEDSWLPYALLCVLCVWVMTVKLSGALILLLTVKPAVMLIREKRGKEIAKFLGLGALTVLPFLIRNVILSGWLVYPFTSVDLFSFDFKIPKGMAEYDSKEIQVWGRGFSDVTRFDEPAFKWLPKWAAALDSVNKVFLFSALSGLILLLGLGVYALYKKRKDMADFLLTAGSMGICFLFWLLSAPLIRYGCVYLWVFPTLVWGYVYLRVSPQLDRYRIYAAFLILAGCYKAGAFTMELVQSADADHLVLQKDYENFETAAYKLQGYTFYYPKEGDRTGYDAFPASPVKAEEGMLRGESIKDGFRDVIHQ